MSAPSEGTWKKSELVRPVRKGNLDVDVRRPVPSLNGRSEPQGVLFLTTVFLEKKTHFERRWELVGSFENMSNLDFPPGIPLSE
jgi:hypothetical protein